MTGCGLGRKGLGFGTTAGGVTGRAMDATPATVFGSSVADGDRGGGFGVAGCTTVGGGAVTLLVVGITRAGRMRRVTLSGEATASGGLVMGAANATSGPAAARLGTAAS